MSRKKQFSRNEVIEMLRGQIDLAGSMREYARSVGISAAYVSDVMRGNRDPGPAILHDLGLSKHVTPAVIHYEVS